MKKTLLIVTGLLLIGGLAAGLLFQRAARRPYRGYSSPSIRVEVRPGMGVGAIASLLDRKGVIRDQFLYKVYLRVTFPGVTFKAGEYRFDRPLNFRGVTEKLRRGRVILYKVTVREGLTIQQTARVVAEQHSIKAQDFITACRDAGRIRDIDPGAGDLEGYLFPDTYLVRKGISAGEMVGLMVNRFKRNFTPLMRWQAGELGFSLREVVILASLIEKETALREERFLISSVFHNRLRIGMPLGCDPTIIYALMREDRYDGKLSWEDLKIDSPYNTRIYKGLPPGPICSPGIAAIEGALYPKKTRYLYFVAKDDRSHYFSKTLREHNRAVRRYIINR